MTRPVWTKGLISDHAQDMRPIGIDSFAQTTPRFPCHPTVPPEAHLVRSPCPPCSLQTFFSITSSALTSQLLASVKAAIKLPDHSAHPLPMSSDRLLYPVRSVADLWEDPPSEEEQDAKSLEVAVVEARIARAGDTGGAVLLSVSDQAVESLIEDDLPVDGAQLRLVRAEGMDGSHWDCE